MSLASPPMTVRMPLPCALSPTVSEDAPVEAARSTSMSVMFVPKAASVSVAFAASDSVSLPNPPANVAEPTAPPTKVIASLPAPAKIRLVAVELPVMKSAESPESIVSAVPLNAVASIVSDPVPLTNVERPELAALVPI